MSEQQILGLPRKDLTEAQLRELSRRIRPRWWWAAACAQVGGDLWFPDHERGAERSVWAVCAGCRVRRSCLAAAMRVDEHGVWGGTTPNQRATGVRRIRAGVDVGHVLDQLLDKATPDSRRGRRIAGLVSPAPLPDQHAVGGERSEAA